MKIADLAKDVKNRDEAHEELKNEMSIALTIISESRYPLTCAHIWVNFVFTEEDFTAKNKIIRILLGAVDGMRYIEPKPLEDIVNDVIFKIFDI